MEPNVGVGFIPILQGQSTNWPQADNCLEVKRLQNAAR